MAKVRVAEDELSKGRAHVTSFAFDRYDRHLSRMVPYGKGFLHNDSAECEDSKNCREKSHAVFFTWKEVVRAVFSPVIGTAVYFVALPAKKGQAPRAISLKLVNGNNMEGAGRYDRPEKTISRRGR
ncbi:MAG: hypothetical protein Q7S12_01705 [bacterium]|nr:hypothetical protein [bacterium]